MGLVRPRALCGLVWMKVFRSRDNKEATLVVRRVNGLRRSGWECRVSAPAVPFWTIGIAVGRLGSAFFPVSSVPWSASVDALNSIQTIMVTMRA